MQGLFDFSEPKRANPTAPQEVDGLPPPIVEDRGEQLEAKTYQVTELVRAAGRTLEARYGVVWVEGEVSNLSPSRAGHVYFALKDAEALLPSVMFRAQANRLDFQLADGLKVRARGKLSIFAGNGKFQLIVEALEQAGLGPAQIAFEQLKKRLHAEGLFDPARKRRLPAWPRRIGLATSPTGAAIRDVLRIAQQRGRMRFLIAPCQVQGPSAPQEIIAALRLLERQPDIDVIIVGRGGGSAEDLAAFNDEGLARAIAGCRVPVVSAVGHEVDFTIADFVADLRAATPSNAAELVVPLFADAEARLKDAYGRLLRSGRRTLVEARQRLDVAQERTTAAFKQGIARRRRLLDTEGRKLAGLHPKTRLDRDRAVLLALRKRLETRIRVELDQRRRAFATSAGKLDAMSPLKVLERGYSLTRDAAGKVLTLAADVSAGDPVTVKLARGELECVVQSVVPQSHNDDGEPQ